MCIRDRLLLREAEKALKNAYAPYSCFRVGAALLAKKKNKHRIFTGVNVETATFSSICAERIAIGNAVSAGYKNFLTIALIGRGKLKIEKPLVPCGPCRQMLYEFCSQNPEKLRLICSNSDKTKILLCTLAELLPLGFGPADLLGKKN